MSDRLLDGTMHCDATFSCFAQNQEIVSIHSERIIILTMHTSSFSYSNSQVLSCWLLFVFGVPSPHSFIPLPIFHGFLPIFHHFCSFSHFWIRVHSILCSYLVKVYLNIKLWQLIYGKWLSLLIKCISCFSEWKFHGKCIGTRCQQI